MMSSGHKFLAMEGVTPDMLTKGGCEEDYPRMQKLAAKVREIFTKGKRVRVTSKLGTDLTASLEGRPGYVAAGKADKQPNISLLAAAFPDGEAAFAPVEGSGEGIVVFDTTMHFLGRLKSPLKIRVAKGKATGFEGEQAGELQEILKKYGDENSLVFPAEIAVGLNSKVIPTGSIRTDKKIYGSVHIAFGMNSDIAGQTDSKLHLDGVIRYPDVMIDEKVIVSSGSIRDI
jgi:leucyl aminopeptidase (aminopeptidase T)